MVYSRTLVSFTYEGDANAFHDQELSRGWRGVRDVALFAAASDHIKTIFTHKIRSEVYCTPIHIGVAK